jgi:hypothetical protein
MTGRLRESIHESRDGFARDGSTIKQGQAHTDN